MIKIENTEVHGWEAAIRGMRSPMKSWEKSDSCVYYTNDEYSPFGDKYGENVKIGQNDLTLMKKLVNAGSDHSKFMRMINVTCDITAPRYWWPEFDTYKVGTVRDSCSTMHTIAEKEFTVDDFSHEHLYDANTNPTFYKSPTTMIKNLCECLNYYRERYLRIKSKEDWWQIIQLLPQSYNQRATVQLNYQVLRNMYHARKSHKLDEWLNFCRWVESLPYSKLITGV